MNIVPTSCLVAVFGLVAVFAGPLHAQVCSGGAGGGIDATGNQCGDAATIELYVNGSDIAAPRPTAKMSGIQRSTAATADTHPTAKMSVAPAISAAPAQGIGRFAKAVMRPSAPVKTSKIETVDASPCAGGPNGGMDATGNECAAYPVAEMNAGSIVAAKR